MKGARGAPFNKPFWGRSLPPTDRTSVVLAALSCGPSTGGLSPRLFSAGESSFSAGGNSLSTAETSSGMGSSRIGVSRGYSCLRDPLLQDLGPCPSLRRCLSPHARRGTHPHACLGLPVRSALLGRRAAERLVEAPWRAAPSTRLPCSFSVQKPIAIPCTRIESRPSPARRISTNGARPGATFSGSSRSEDKP